MLVSNKSKFKKNFGKVNNYVPPKPIPLYDLDEVRTNTEKKHNCCEKDKRITDINERYKFFYNTDVCVSAFQKLMNQAGKIEPIVYEVTSTVELPDASVRRGKGKPSDTATLLEKRAKLKSCLSKGFKPNIVKDSDEKFSMEKLDFFRDDDLTVQSAHPFSLILERPNREINTWSAFIMQWTVQRYFMPYIDIVAVLDPDERQKEENGRRKVIGVKIVSGFNIKKTVKGETVIYSYSRGGKDYKDTYNATDVYTYREYNPIAELEPLVPIDSIWDMLELYNQTLVWAKAKFKGDVHGTFFTVNEGESLHAPAKELIQDNLLEQSGADGYGAFVLDERIKSVVKQFNPQEMDYFNTHIVLRNEISSFFDTHPILMATVQATYNNFEQARLQQQEAGAIPAIQKIIEHLQPLVQDYYGAQFYLWYDTRNAAGMVLEETHKLNWVTQMKSFIQVDEARKKLDLPEHADKKIGQLTLFENYNVNQENTPPTDGSV